MLRAQQISLRLGSKTILKQVDFQAEAGQITVLLGRNGSGKTSLLRCLAMTQTRWQGQVTLDGCPLRSLTPQERSRRIALLPQVLPRPPITVRTLTSYGRQPYLGWGGQLSAADEQRVQRAMDEAEIAAHAEDLVCHCSGGERQLAYFAMLLAQDTPVVLLDEPTASLDMEYRRVVYALLRRMKAEGKTVVLILHELADAVELADQICVLDQGTRVFTGTPEDFLISGLPQSVFGLCPKQVKDETGNEFILFRPLNQGGE